MAEIRESSVSVSGSLGAGHIDCRTGSICAINDHDNIYMFNFRINGS